MIQSFKNELTETIHKGYLPRRFPANIAKRAKAKLQMIDAAVEVFDLSAPPGNRLEKLGGDRAGQWSIRINDQWRISFVWKEGNAYDVEIEDYH